MTEPAMTQPVMTQPAMTGPAGRPNPPVARPAPVLVVAAAIVDDLDLPRALLAARRSTPARLAGRWEFPGGKVDPGETPLEALHREISEELGVRILVGSELSSPAGGAWPLSARYRMRLWLAVVVDGSPAPHAEHDELRWLPTGRWHDVPWLDADRPIVTALAAHVS